MSGAIRRAKRLVRGAQKRGERAVGTIVDSLRLGDRVVINTPPAGMRLGNFLYIWLHAHLRSARGENIAVLESRGMAQWCREFPALAALTISREDLRFSDRREWDPVWLYQRFDVDYTRQQLHAFIDDAFGDRVAADDTGHLVVNVRRGDFYTEFRAKHSFDVVPYVKAALEQFDGVRRALVVSDDADWCQENLDELIRARIPDVEYAPADPLQNLRALAETDMLIGANSTFSYWGAYIADALHTDAKIVMPRFHARMEHGTNAHQLDPRWIALDGFH